MTQQEIYNCFFDSLETLTKFSDKDKEFCLKVFKPFNLAKDEIYQKIGEIPKYFNFVVDGLMRKFLFDEQGNEITIDFSRTPAVFNSWDEFIGQKPAVDSIQAITDCIILRITYKDFNDFLQTSEAAKICTIKTMQAMIRNSQNRAFDLAFTSATERYNKFVKEHPVVSQNAPLMHISSYLGIRPQSLSRIRSRLVLTSSS